MNNAFLFKELMQQWTDALLWIKIALCWMEGSPKVPCTAEETLTYAYQDILSGVINLLSVCSPKLTTLCFLKLL